MSLPGRPKAECGSAQHEGTPASLASRPKVSCTALRNTEVSR